MIVINPGTIEFERLGLSVDEDADRSIKGDGLLQLIDVSFCNVHIEVEFSTSCSVLEVTKPLLLSMKGIELFAAGENSRHFATPPLVFRQMASKERAQKFHTDDADRSTTHRSG